MCIYIHANIHSKLLMRNLELLFVGERTVKFAIYCIKEIHFKVRILANNIRLNFYLAVIAEMLVTCCEKQYVGSTVTKFRSIFNQYKSNMNLYWKGQSGFMQEPLIEHFFSNKHNVWLKDIKVQIIDYCDPNNLERREGFWIYHLDTIYLRGLYTRKFVLWFWLLFDDLCFMISILALCLIN